MEIHILNGDALRAQFPKTLSGELIVLRECLVDGEPRGESLEALFKHRMAFLKGAYGIQPEEYRRKTIPELERILNLKESEQVNLWFEDDLFCQVNLWFTVYLLRAYTSVVEVTLVRPDGDLQYGFGGMDETALGKAYTERQVLSRFELEKLAELWPYYQEKDHDAMQRVAESLRLDLPFLPLVVAANRDRYPGDNSLGRPQRRLKELMDELGSKHFGPIFQAFNARESIYGYGDLQVKRLFDELLVQ